MSKCLFTSETMVFNENIACGRFEGFLQVYQLKTEADEEETWRDLVRCQTGFYNKKCLTASKSQSIHGFDRTLRLVATRREDYEMDDIMETDMEDAQSCVGLISTPSLISPLS